MTDKIISNEAIELVTGDITRFIIIIVVIIVLFFLYILVKRNFSEMAYQNLVGKFVKYNRKYRRGDIFEYDKKEWYLDALNTYDIKFKEVIERTQKEITLSNKQLIIPYSLFIKKRMWCGHFGM